MHRNMSLIFVKCSWRLLVKWLWCFGSVCVVFFSSSSSLPSRNSFAKYSIMFKWSSFKHFVNILNFFFCVWLFPLLIFFLFCIRLYFSHFFALKKLRLANLLPAQLFLASIEWVCKQKVNWTWIKKNAKFLLINFQTFDEIMKSNGREHWLNIIMVLYYH